MQYVNLTEASQRLPSLVDAALSGEEVVIQKDDQTAVKLVSVPLSRQEKRRHLFGIAKGRIKISEDFDEPLEEFKDYME